MCEGNGRETGRIVEFPTVIDKRRRTTEHLGGKVVYFFSPVKHYMTGLPKEEKLERQS